MSMTVNACKNFRGLALLGVWRPSPYLSLLLSGQSLTVLDLMADLPAQCTGSGLVGLELLTDDGEVGLVCCQPQHDQVS